MEKCLNEITKKLLCRESILTKLYSLIGENSEPLPPNLFIYGHVATGKSLTLKTFLDYLNYNYTVINCIESISSKTLFNYILQDISRVVDTDLPKCDNFVDFVFNLKKIAEIDKRPIFVIFENCEKMRETEITLLPAFLKLQEISRLNVCTVLVSEIVWEKFRTRNGFCDPIKIYFPQYSRDEITQILLLYKPEKCNEALYRNYLNLFLSVFFRFCRDLNELRHMAKVNFSKFIEPIVQKQMTESDIPGLWKNISPTLKANLELIYLRVLVNDPDESLCNLESTKNLALSFELPFYAKFMLIAAFLAAYNPPSEDKKLFCKHTKKSRKSKKKKLPTKKVSGMKNFPVSRMLAIFCSILEERIDINANLLAQIPTMCQLGLLSVIGEQNLDEPKLKCCVGKNFVTVIGKTVGFELRTYLYDAF